MVAAQTTETRGGLGLYQVGSLVYLQT
jgi:hypothetical protein